jgi:cell division protease FtsH
MPFLGREMAAEPDYSEEISRLIDDEIFAVIDDAHSRARSVLEEHIEELHKLSGILIERETIDKDQFLLLLAGEPEEAVFPEEADEEVEGEKPKAGEGRKRLPRPKPFPLPGQAMQPPPPEGAQS